MAYRCPVCGSVEADGAHLGSHLAITAIREPDHEAWLNDHVAGWEQEDRAGLADAVTEHVDELEYQFDSGGSRDSDGGRSG